MSKSLTIIIPDYKSLFLKEVIDSAIKLNPEKIVISNYKTELTQKISEKYKEIKNIKFLNFDNQKNPGEYRNLGAKEAYTENLLFIDSDVKINIKTLDFVKKILKEGLSPNKIYWGIYSKFGQGVFSKIQNKILRYRFSKIFQKKADEKNKPYCGQSSHFLIKKETFDYVGGFNPYLRIREDNDFCVRSHILNIKNEVYEEFEADHLKNFSFFSDYFVKPSHAAFVKFKEQEIFNLPNAQIGPLLLTSWIFTPFLVTALFFTHNFVQINNFYSILIILLINFLFIPIKLKKTFSLFDKIISVFFLPIIGLFFILGGVQGIIWGLFDLIKNFTIDIFDYFKIFYKILLRNGKPIQIVNFITSRCNMRCSHCFYHDTLNAKDPGEMKIDIIDGYTKKFGSLLWYALGGGEPFIRSDLHLLYEKVEKNCRPKIFTIPTNGWYEKKIFDSTLRMLQFSKGKKNIIIQFSLDGEKEMHDDIRGKDSYKKLLQSLEKLKKLSKIYKKLHMSIITVVTDKNRDIYPQFIDELVKLGTNQININLFRYGSLDHPPLPNETINKYKEAVERYESLIKNKKLKKYSFLGAKLMRLKEALQKDLIYEVAKNNKFVTPCTAGDLSYVVWEDGRVNACEILPDTIGNVNTSDVQKDLFSSKKALELRKKIKDTKCKCTYECAMSTNTFFSWNMTKKMIKGYLTNRV